MAKKKSRKKPSKDADTAIQRTQIITDSVTTILTTLIKWGALVVIFYIGYMAIHVLAGKHTFANISFKWIMSKGLVGLLGGLFGAGSIVYGRREARLRKDTVERMHIYQELYEKSLDPDRTTSSLTSRGDTREGD